MKYFAYGSNMDCDRLRERGVRFSRREKAVLEWYRLVFNKRSTRNPGEGYANIVKDEGGVVEGILYEIADKDIERLDRFEGYPHHYDRRKVEVRLQSGEVVDAVAYIANRKMTAEGLKPSRGYLNHLLKGCDLLSKEYCEKLRNTPTLD
jgi:cation transport regulator ChaC